MTAYTAPGIYRETISFEVIESTVCQFYGVHRGHLYDRDRKHTVRWCRHLVAFFAVEMLGTTLVSIGRHMGMHHTSIINCRKAVQDRKDTEQFFAAEVGEIRKRIKAKVTHIAP